MSNGREESEGEDAHQPPVHLWHVAPVAVARHICDLRQGPAPQNGRSNTNTGKKTSQAFGRRAENDLLAIRLQSSNTLFSAARTSNSMCLVLWSK
jgi:hypothetical protein